MSESVQHFRLVIKLFSLAYTSILLGSFSFVDLVFLLYPLSLPFRYFLLMVPLSLLLVVLCFPTINATATFLPCVYILWYACLLTATSLTALVCHLHQPHYEDLISFSLSPTVSKIVSSTKAFAPPTTSRPLAYPPICFRFTLDILVPY